MFNKKSRTSAIMLICTALLLIGLMILLPMLQFQQEEGEDLAGLVVIVVILYGFPLVYASSIAFVIVALIFGIRMLVQQSRKKLISFNVRTLITTCVLLPVLALGLAVSYGLIVQSTLGLFPIIYTAIVAVAYTGGLIAQIVTVAVLKKTPEEGIAEVEE